MTELKILALQVSEQDNVATVFSDASINNVVEVSDKKGNRQLVKVLDDIPFGHKVALKEIKRGEQIIKYSEEIGIATKDIKVGEYVHVHNLDSMRGRGDWQKEENCK